MAEVLCVYREVEMRRAVSGGAAQEPAIAVISYDEKPGIQAIGSLAPDLRPVPGSHPTISRDHEYKRHGTVTLMAGIDLLTGRVHALVKDRHRSREFIEFLIMCWRPPTPPRPRSRSSSTITSRMFRRRPRRGLRRDPEGRFRSCSPPSTGPGPRNLVEGFFAKAARSLLRHMRVGSKTRAQTTHHGVHR